MYEKCNTIPKICNQIKNICDHMIKFYEKDETIIDPKSITDDICKMIEDFNKTQEINHKIKRNMEFAELKQNIIEGK